MIKTRTEGEAIELSDGYYQDGLHYYCVQGKDVHCIMIDFTPQYHLTNDILGYLSKDYIEISFEKWREIVANLLATIYLSLPIDREVVVNFLHNENLQKDKI